MPQTLRTFLDSIDNRMLIRRISDGHRVPFNYGLSAGISYILGW